MAIPSAPTFEPTGILRVPHVYRRACLPRKQTWRDAAHSLWSAGFTAHVECGSLLPLSAGRACPDVLQPRPINRAPCVPHGRLNARPLRTVPYKRPKSPVHRRRLFFTPTGTCANPPPGVKIFFVSSDCAHSPEYVSRYPCQFVILSGVARAFSLPAFFAGAPT